MKFTKAGKQFDHGTEDPDGADTMRLRVLRFGVIVLAVLIFIAFAFAF